MKKAIFILVISLFVVQTVRAQHGSNKWKEVSADWIRENVTTNPVTPAWITEHIKEESPRLILTEDIEKKLGKDNLSTSYVAYLRQYAEEILAKPVLKREKVGRRLLGVSRDGVRRMGTLALLYRLDRKEKYLDRLAREIEAVSEFSDWNPSHFLDVAEMSYAVAISLDWAGEWLPESTIKKARSALKRHIQMSFNDEGYSWWINAHNNWNQVCHGGLSAAALVLADEYPELASKVISRAVDKLPLSMSVYSPDGAYPEGPTYWDYGTSYNLLALSFYETALGTDFNLASVPGFMESAVYRMVVVGPSGKSFNYFDAGYGALDLGTLSSLAWFAQKTGDSRFFAKTEMQSQLKKKMESREEPSRFASSKLIWISQFEKKNDGTLPLYWKADGRNPIAIFRSEEDEETGFYLGLKGGSASVNHGNMDAGSFIFELNGVRWSIDPGNQSYNALEQTIGTENLWNQSQDSQRWSLLTKGNQFHSTLTVNGQRHNVDGFASISSLDTKGETQKVSVDLDAIFEGQLKSVQRQFEKVDEQTLQIQDTFTPSEQTASVTWSMMTQAEVETVEGGAILRQDNQELYFNIIQPENIDISVTSLNPPPLPYDKKIEGLKRIEVTIPGYQLKNNEEKQIVVELTAAE